MGHRIGYGRIRSGPIVTATRGECLLGEMPYGINASDNPLRETVLPLMPVYGAVSPH